ncbi:mitochondrial inner membrane protein Oxa1p [Diutina catenulata]
MMLRTLGARMGVRHAFPTAFPAAARTRWAQMAPLGVRYNSTESLKDNLKDKLHHVEDEISDKLIGFDHHPTSVPQTDLTADQLGYLDSIGLAQGWGPTAMVEKWLEVVHVYTGLPWWATIVVATLGVRMAMFPLYSKASANAAKMIPVKPELDMVMAEMKQASSPQEQYKAMNRRKQILKEHDIHMSHQMLPVLQLPVAYGFFQALRKMGNANVDGFETQGIAWFQDLTQVDPYLGLQLGTAAIVMLMIKMGGETGGSTMSAPIKKLMMVLPLASIFITKSFSAGVVLYFAVNSAFSMVQTTLLRSNGFRKMMKLPLMTKPPVLEGAPKQPETISEWYQNFVKKSKDSAVKSARETNTKMEALQKKRDGSTGGFIKRHKK